ncbi:aminotransferase class IV [Antribacter gilvus]|uniref:aminotransferase class IV n=1 Tax=Antribacter gilvus TaxID=2304675 RepID=UPI000F788445|nr:aminotransferase class IV [Antribacter gilvus]
MAAELDGHPVTAEHLQALALTGYGHFTSMRVDRGRVRGLTLHLQRLARDAETLFGTDLDIDHVRRLVRKAAPPDGSVVVRVTVFDPDLTLGEPEKVRRPRVLVTTRPAGALDLPPLRVQTRIYERDLPATKSTGLFATIAHRRAARLDGYDDALFTTPDGTITEGATWNVGFVVGTDVIWPEGKMLHGVTLDLLALEGGHPTRRIACDDLKAFDLAFATNAAVGVRAISAIDAAQYKTTHPTLDTLRRRYLAIEADPV